MLLFDASLHVRQVKSPEGPHPPCARHSHKGVARISDGSGAQPLQRVRKSEKLFEAVVADEPAANQSKASAAYRHVTGSRARRRDAHVKQPRARSEVRQRLQLVALRVPAAPALGSARPHTPREL